MAEKAILEKIYVNEGVGVPIYRQIKEQVESLVESNQLKPGDMLPSETKLAEHLGVSRMTVRQAMQELVQQGLAIRKRGKGTIISPPKIVQPLFAVTSFTDSMSEAGVTVRNKLLHFELIAPDPLLRKNLQIGEGDLAIEILRMREASGLPVSLQRSFLSFDLAKNLVEIQDKLSTESLYKLLATYCNVTPAATSETLEIRSAKSSHAKLLNIATGDPLFYVEAITRSKDGVPIEYVEAYYRGDRFKFTLFNKL